MPILLAVFLFLSTAHAGLGNVWSGTGFAETLKTKNECEWIEIRLIHTEDTLIIRGGGYLCDDLLAEYPYSTFEINNGRLYYQGEVTGEIEENKLHISALGGQYNLWLKIKDDGNLFYRELWSERTDFLWIEGTLESSPIHDSK